MWKLSALWLSALLLSHSAVVEGVLQTAALDIMYPKNGSFEYYTILVSQASFGSYPPMKPKEPTEQAAIGPPLQLPPSDNKLLCNNVTSSGTTYSGLLLVPRGECTFELKALNAQRLGAKGIAIYGTLASRYSLNTTKYINQTDHTYTTDDIVYPQKYFDYDCDKGRAEIPASVH